MPHEDIHIYTHTVPIKEQRRERGRDRKEITRMVSSLLMSFAPATVRVYATTAKGASGGAKEEKNPLDFVLGYLTKQDQFYETDPILQKVEEKEVTRSSGTKSGGTTSGRGTVRGGGKNSAPVPVPPKKNDGGFGGLGGLFNKK
uniref:Thylakoid soluble phosphoprotein TSP9 n=1 Tax=Noccaea caerulescens TaxID=107243 RepID=A0A1J3JLK0_NOCCA